MMLYLLNRLFWIAIVGGLIAGVMALHSWDAQAEQAATEAYCHDVATWLAEEARGIHPLHRTGQPDYRGIAADVCPGLRPAH